MKRGVLLLGIFINFFALAQTQKTVEFLNEDFSSGVPPEAWIIENMEEQWSQAFSAHAGGTSPEAQLHWSNGIFSTRLISPELDLTGLETILFSFSHFLDDYSGGNSIGVSTRSEGGGWSDIWSVVTSNDIGPEIKDLLISNNDVGASDFQISFYLSGNFHNFNKWYIDDAQVYYPNNNDVAMESVNVLPYGEEGDYDFISCTFKNIGFSTINSININYQFDDGSIVIENTEGLNLQITDKVDYTFNTPWEATSGNFVLNVWVSNANNNGEDDDTSNDIKTKNISVATQYEDNIPLFEVFTSSTCPPCNFFNSEIIGPFMQDHPDDIAVIKYQMYWPAPGDPYYTEEGGERKIFYGVSHVPSLFAGGKQIPTNINSLVDAFNSESLKHAFFKLIADYSVNEDIINVSASIIPYISADLKVHIVVLEKETIGNIGSNGETSFEHVMMKMLPDAEGTLVSFEAESGIEINESFDMSLTNVEEMDDLLVVVFIQDDTTKQVLQSIFVNNIILGFDDNNLLNTDFYPNPSNGYLTIATDRDLQVTIYDILGKNVYSRTGINKDELNLTHLNNGMYLVKMNDGEHQVTKKLIINK